MTDSQVLSARPARSSRAWAVAAALLLIVACGPVRSGEWYRGAGRVTVAHISPEEAREQALQLARSDALAQASLQVTGTTSRLISESGSRGEIYDHFVRFTRSVARGRITEENILVDELEIDRDPEGRPVPVYRIELEAEVNPEQREADPSFRLSLRLNRESYRVGEPVRIELHCSQDCHLTLFNLYANDSLSVILPNFMQPDSRLEAGGTLRIPPDEAGWSLPVRLSPGRSEDEELILAVALKDDLPFAFEARAGPAGSELISMGDALQAINRWLAEVPADRRTQSALPYRVTR